MPQPPSYDRQFNFQNQQTLTPADPLPADEVDSEYNAIKITLDATLANLNLIQRDDGELGNETVGVDQLKPELDGFAATAASAIAAKVAAEAAAVAAASSQSSASTSAMAANTARSDAQLAETNAELAQTASEAAATAAAASATQLIGFSSTSNDIGLGSKSFTTQASKFFDPGTSLLITSDAAPAADYMHGRATLYAGTSLVIDVAVFGGSGTHTDWTIRVSGTVGAQGADGTDGTDGTNGTNGVDGDVGPAGAAGAPGIQFVFDAGTTDSDPGPGKFRFNNADPAAATAVYIDNEEVNTRDVAAWLDAFDDTGTAADRGKLRIIDPESPENLYIFTVSGSVVDGTGYRKLTIAYISGGGTLNVGDAHSFAVFPKGDTGDPGPQGDPGPAGSGSGDVIGPGTTVNSEIVLFNGTTGTSIKRATQTGILKAASGVIAAAVAGTDYMSPANVAAAYQPLDADLTAIAAVATTSFGRSLLASADGPAARTAIGAGDVVGASAGALAGVTTLSMSGAITIGTTAGTAPVIDPSGFGQMPEIAAPATPATGHVRFYAKADGHLYQKDDAGLETDLAAAAAGAGGMSAKERQNFALSLIYQAKAFSGYRRIIDMFADGFKASDGVASITGGAVDTTNARVSPTVVLTRVSSGITPTMPKGGTAANINDNAAGTVGTTGAIGNMTGFTVNQRIIARLDLGSVKIVTKIELLQAGFVTTATAANGGAFYRSDDNATWVQCGSNFGLVQTVADDNVTGSFSGRYFIFIMEADNFGASTLTIGDMNVYTDAPNNMTVVSTAQTSDAARTKASGLIEYNPIEALTLNTDITMEFTCNGGTNWTAGTLTAVGLGQGGRLVAETNEVTCTSGTSFQYRFKSLTNKNYQLFGATVEVGA